MIQHPPPPRPGRGRAIGPWLVLGLAIAWVALARVPLVLNAAGHLDSDLAVDGLTLLDATRGHWRWHYPGTPHMGALPVLLSWAQAMAWGVGPIALVSGGVVAYAGLILATFGLNRRAFGASAACWGLVPLAFASTGTIWLSGRITGGHLLTAAWHAGAFALLYGCLARGGARRSAILGLWSGLGLSLDSMFAVTWLGLVPAAALGWWWGGRGEAGPRPAGRATACVLAFALAAGLGLTPRALGAWADPHDAYREQFEPVTRGDVLAGHAKILALDCLPRLIAGHRLPGLQAEPDPATLAGGAGGSGGPRGGSMTWLAAIVATASLALFAGAMSSLAFDPPARLRPGPDRPPGLADPARRAVRWGLLLSSAAVVAGFVANRNIFNSDNYRYLVFLLVPSSAGTGLLLGRRASRGPAGAWLAGAVALGFAALMTADSARWYARLGWVDASGRPVRKAVDDPAPAWLAAHPEVTAIFADYWDAYRLAFLAGGRVRGVPFPEYPDRFPEVGRGLPGGRPRTLIVRPGPVGPLYRARALSEGGREVHRAGGLSVVDWPPRTGTSP